MTVWPDNARAVRLFSRVLGRWHMDGAGLPMGLRWESIYPLMDRMALEPGEWDALAADLEVMESAACSLLRERIAQRRERQRH